MNWFADNPEVAAAIILACMGIYAAVWANLIWRMWREPRPDELVNLAELPTRIPSRMNSGVIEDWPMPETEEYAIDLEVMKTELSNVVKPAGDVRFTSEAGYYLAEENEQ